MTIAEASKSNDDQADAGSSPQLIRGVSLAGATTLNIGIVCAKGFS